MLETAVTSSNLVFKVWGLYFRNTELVSFNGFHGFEEDTFTLKNLQIV